ncbi:MAG: hypothetical protein F9K29_18280 [Hyphomicrobiaceae bacterium]|nr:MAG: hypothetical protein F9K29_18280 [Hyphomicrobiaceae bacterium]
MTGKPTFNLPEGQFLLKLTYACHMLDDGRTICGRNLAQQLIEDALKLLVPSHVGEVDRAWEELCVFAARSVNELKAKEKAGGNIGLLLSAPLKH